MEQENVYLEKKIFIFSIFIVTLLIITSIVICYLMLNESVSEKMSQAITPQAPIEDNDINVEAIKPTPEPFYELKDYNGKIGIYEDDSLIYTLDVFIFTLPQADQLLLKDGIIVTSKVDLMNLIEEYY